MKVVITARELMDRSLWNRACELTGRSSWVVNEGQMDMDDEMTLPAGVADALGLLAPGVAVPVPDEPGEPAEGGYWGPDLTGTGDAQSRWYPANGEQR